MDIATILGVVLGFGVILASLVMGGGAMAFIDVPSIIIVVEACSANDDPFSLPQFLGIFLCSKAILIKIQPKRTDPEYGQLRRHQPTRWNLGSKSKFENRQSVFGQRLQMLVDGRNEEKSENC